MKLNIWKYIIILSTFVLIIILISETSFLNLCSGILKNNTKNNPAFNLQESTNDPDKTIYNSPKKTIVLDPGHGGSDPGTLKGSLYEKDITLSISKKLGTYLADMGYSVLLTRYSDISSYKPSDIAGSLVRKDLDGRINYAKEHNANLFVSIHVDSLPEDLTQNGSVVYYYPTIAASKSYAASVQNALNSILLSDIPRSKNSERTENFYVIKNSAMPSILVETGFITNSQDRKLLSQDEFRDKLAKAIAEGIDQLKLLK